METSDTIRARRNVRTYQDRPIAAGDLDRILQAGWRSPSASNRQPWDFVGVTDRCQLQELTTVWMGARHLAEAPAAIVMTLRQPEQERYLTIDQYDLGPGDHGHGAGRHRSGHRFRPLSDRRPGGLSAHP